MPEQRIPKYQQLASTLRDMIFSEEFSSGDRLETEKEMSERFGVSRQTVRQAVSSLVNEGLLIRKQGSGTYVNDTIPKDVSARRQNTIVFISTYITDYLFPSIIRGMETVVTAHGYSLILHATKNRVDNEKKILLSLLENLPAGLIVEGTKTAFANPNVGLYRKISDFGVPIVFVNGFYPELNLPYVVTDDYGGGQKAVNFLVSHGHTQIGGLFKVDDMQGRRRYEGFLNEITSQGLDIHDDSIVWFTTETREQLFTGEQGLSLLQSFSRCTAIVCYNDQVALNLVSLFLKNGISVPRDKAVISFDNSLFANISPVRLTSLDHPKEKLGQLAAENVIRLINGENIQPVIMPWGFDEKESV